MNFQQIMIRLGVDGTAVAAGLRKVSAIVKAWGASLAHGMKEYTGSIMKGFLGAEAVTKSIEYLGEIKEKILEVARISHETGASTNFVQSLELDAREAGKTFQGMDMSLIRFNDTLGEAKMGSAEAIKKLYDLGVISNNTQVKTLTFTKAINSLAVQFDKLNDKQKQSALLQQSFGRGAAAMSPVFEKGAKHVEEMSKGNFFTKISSGAIDDFETAWTEIKIISTGAMATVANTIDSAFKMSIGYKGVSAVKDFFNLAGRLSTGHIKQIDYVAEHELENQDRINAGKALELTADKEQISVQELKSKILEDQTKLLESQAELTSEIADRDKESVTEMASRARKLTGIKGPLEMLHSVTPRMRTALRIETLEERAKVAFLRGDDKTSNRLQSEADQVRKSNPWLKRSDVNPMAKTEAQLQIVNTQLEPVKRMAELVNKTQ